ncbi:MAG: hypothetical protein WB664_09065, partial [Nitrososphaeraceae archaeon]
PNYLFADHKLPLHLLFYYSRRRLHRSFPSKTAPTTSVLAVDVIAPLFQVCNLLEYDDATTARIENQR